MKPEVKATITLLFVILAIGAGLYFFVIYPWIFPLILGSISAIAILGVIWYSLYKFFGGED